MQYGSQSEVGKIKSILLKHPKDAFINQSNVDAQWKNLRFLDCPDFEKALREYDYFMSLLMEDIPEIHLLPQDMATFLDSIYVHDPIIITKKGAILCNMGKTLRRDEPSAAGDAMERLGIPVLGAITGGGRLEGGDVVWLDEETLAVGHGYRTNAEGIRQLRQLTSGMVSEFIIVPLPHWQGPGEVLHLMSLISPVDHDLAVVYSRLLPVPFRDRLLERSVKLVEVPDSEFETMGCNVLAVAPRRCIMLSGNPQTKKLLEAEGADVREYDGKEISHKGAGGPTCLTRPLLRSG